ncbi:host cell division inhibitor Icd-like protein [Salmonella enterica]|nr:host cell division inhibitor Icd-like protein [Salmonella enterica]EBR7328949.1 host cell division inhibitor Icd-like protein [Salmonella enterica]
MPQRRQITAPDYLTARRLIARDHIAVFAGRIPCRTSAYNPAPLKRDSGFLINSIRNTKED